MERDEVYPLEIDWSIPLGSIRQLRPRPAYDILDAAAAAWSAQRILRGEAGVFPAPAEAGNTGRRGVIWY
jgi:hypothetical protein